MFVNLTRPFTGSNKCHVPGFSVSAPFFVILVEHIPFLFFKHDSHILYLLVYVDDIILTGNDPYLIHKFISKLHSEFAVKDLGALNNFLGLEVSYTDDGLFLTQAKHAHDILLREDMLDSKSVSTPLATS
uniref:Reverse transcriptase Ty1/copia-type domain-containing protein n=1 Tax=Lactuca sativa TaxID=4236 RepID=A0A9R1WL63_LACSA|nr:hypothetical protein LSAT_V11C100029510 [Lactuca sativa]